MTTPSARLRLTTVDTEATVRIELRGDLDYDNADCLLEAVTAQLAARPRLEDLHLHCAGLGVIDSMGLSVLLMIHRRTGLAGVRLHLDDCTPRLLRILTITGTLDPLTASPSTAASPPADTGEAPSAGAEARAARPTGPNSTT